MRTLAGNGEAGFADGQFVRPGRQPTDVVVDKEGTIVVADHKNERLRKIVGRQVTTLADGPEAGTADGAGRARAPARGRVRPGAHAAGG